MRTVTDDELTKMFTDFTYNIEEEVTTFIILFKEYNYNMELIMNRIVPYVLQAAYRAIQGQISQEQLTALENTQTQLTLDMVTTVMELDQQGMTKNEIVATLQGIGKDTYKENKETAAFTYGLLLK